MLSVSKKLLFKSESQKKYHSLVLLFFIFSIQQSVAATYYVNDNSTKGDIYTTSVGNDSNDGTSANPKLSLSATYEKANEGDTIIIDTGSYPDLSADGKLLFAVTKNVTFIIAGITDAVFSKNPLPLNTKVNPTEIYIDKDKPVNRETYLQNLRNNESKKSR